MQYRYFLLAVLGLTAPLSCKPEFVSATKSFVGLEKLQEDELRNKSQYPTFIDLSDWFQGFRVSFDGARQSGDRDLVSVKKVTTKRESSYKAALIQYIDSEIARNKVYLDAIENNDRKTVEKLLIKESHELYDIAMVILNPSYSPRTGDKLARLIKSVDQLTFTDIFAEPFLTRVFARMSQREAIERLKAEQISYQKALIKNVLADSKSLAKFRDKLVMLRKQLQKFRDSVTGVSKSDGLGLLNSGSETLPNMSGPNAAFLSYAEGAYDSQVAANNYNGTGPGAVPPPSLSIFEGTAAQPASAVNPENVTASTTSGTQCNSFEELYTCPNGQQVCVPRANPSIAPTLCPNSATTQTPSTIPSTIPTATTTTGQTGLAQLITMIISALGGSGMGLTEDAPQDELPLPPKANFSCAKEGLTGRALVRCERYGATANAVIYKSPDWKPTKGFGLTGTGYSFDIIRNYATKVQNQGSEGACTAFGLVHTLEAAVQPTHRGATFNSKELWARYANYTSNGAINAARSGLRSPDGTVVATTGSSYLNSTFEAKAALDKGQAVYACSTIDNSWYNTSRSNPTVSCSGTGGGHCYSIQGYSDTKQMFIVKNSWGQDYGQEGYIYLPFNCCDSGDCSFILPTIKL